MVIRGSSVESQLYYLQSRYYDPETCRFINSDDEKYLSIVGEITELTSFSYCSNNPIFDKDSNGEGRIKRLAFGFQFCLSIGRVVIGIETLWNTNGAFFTFLFIGGSKDFEKGKQTAREKMITLLKRNSKPKMNWLKTLGFSISFTAVIGNKNAQFPRHYCGWFTGVSFSFRHILISGAISKSGNMTIGSIGIGLTTSAKPCLNVSQTYYIQLSGADSKLNNLSTLKSAVLDQIGWLWLVYSLFM